MPLGCLTMLSFSLRHIFAFHLLERGFPYEMYKILGHSSITSMPQDAQVTRKYLQDHHQAAHPR